VNPSPDPQAAYQPRDELYLWWLAHPSQPRLIGDLSLVMGNRSVGLLNFVGSAKEDLAAFADDAKREAGFDLWQVQLGLMPRDFKPMPTVGAGAYEIRVKVGTQWRVIYVANRADAVYVLHCFQKTSQKTAKPDIDLAARRYKLIGD
jgi:phage-related protein